MLSDTEGYLYVATGAKYIEEATVSVQSLRRCNKHIHATLITDKEIISTAFDEILYLDIDNSDPKAAQCFKVFGLYHSPYSKTFFVDTDTFFIEDCRELFSLLDYYDLLLAHAPSDTRSVFVKGKIIESYMPYNSGVMVYKKNEKMDQLLKSWYDIYRTRNYNADQPPLMEALLSSSIKLYVLQPNFNFRFNYSVSIPGSKVKILHGRKVNFEMLEKRLNKNYNQQRSWIPYWHSFLSKESIYARRISLKKLKKKIKRKLDGFFSYK